MDNILFQSYAVEDRSYVSFIKREIHKIIRPHFSEQRTGEIDIVISELTSNLIKYASTGELLYRLSKEDDEVVFEVICIDNGPGIKDIQHYMKDGNSSTATLGHGIGSIIRQSNLAQFYSLPDWGTIVYCRFYNSMEYKSPPQKIISRCLNVAKPGETVSGDGAYIRKIGNKTIVFAGDGLGHGEHAKEAVDTAIEAVKQTMSADASEIIREMHVAVKRTRGLVGTVTVLDLDRKKWEICGIGNISTRMHKGLEYKNYICNNGIIGLNIPGRIDNNVMDAEKLQQLILCSDGIKTRWEMIQYAGILKYDPMILAATIYKDQARRNDDMTVLIVKTL